MRKSEVAASAAQALGHAAEVVCTLGAARAAFDSAIASGKLPKRAKRHQLRLARLKAAKMQKVAALQGSPLATSTQAAHHKRCVAKAAKVASAAGTGREEAEDPGEAEMGAVETPRGRGKGRSRHKEKHSSGAAGLAAEAGAGSGDEPPAVDGAGDAVAEALIEKLPATLEKLPAALDSLEEPPTGDDEMDLESGEKMVEEAAATVLAAAGAAATVAVQAVAADITSADQKVASRAAEVAAAMGSERVNATLGLVAAVAHAAIVAHQGAVAPSSLHPLPTVVAGAAVKAEAGDMGSAHAITAGDSGVAGAATQTVRSSLPHMKCLNAHAFSCARTSSF